MLRYVELSPGEALFIGAGVPHAYLSGLGVEIMASSDNVLRCGLTSKYVDAEELTRVVRFDEPPPASWSLGSRGRGCVSGARGRLPPVAVPPARRGAAPACDAGRPTDPSLRQRDHHRLLVGDSCVIDPGQAVYVPAGTEAGLEGTGTVFRATTGTAQRVG